MSPFAIDGGLLAVARTVRVMYRMGAGEGVVVARNGFFPVLTVTGAGKLPVLVMTGLGPLLVAIVQVKEPLPIGRVFTNAFLLESQFHPLTFPQFVCPELFIWARASSIPASTTGMQEFQT